METVSHFICIDCLQTKSDPLESSCLKGRGAGINRGQIYSSSRDALILEKAQMICKIFTSSMNILSNLIQSNARKPRRKFGEPRLKNDINKGLAGN
jgi:hypothetical protein